VVVVGDVVVRVVVLDEVVVVVLVVLDDVEVTVAVAVGVGAVPEASP